MPLDVKILTVDRRGVLTAATWPQADFVDGQYALVQRIYKNLMTRPGEDAFDPEWGSDIRGALLGLHAHQVDEAQLALSHVFEKVLADLTSTLPTDPEQRLTRMQLRQVVSDIESGEWRVDADVETEASAVTISLQT